MVRSVVFERKQRHFAATPWTEESDDWKALDRRLPAGHLARRIDRAVALLDLEPLMNSYLGVGKKALRPDLLLKAVLYEMSNNRPSPAQWARDVGECEPLRWLLLGMQPSRARLYDFRDRIASFLRAWNAHVLTIAVEEQMTTAARGALDGSSVAAHASRRQLLNHERLAQRRKVVDERLQQLPRGETATPRPGWLARTESGLRAQQRRYALAAEVLGQRQAANAQRRAGKRKPAEKVLISATDPQAVLARDKLNVFRPLYSPQLLRDLDSPLVLAYDVLPQVNDNGVVQPMVEQLVENVGHKPETLLVDSGYVSLAHLEFCEQAGITIYGPWQEHDYSQQNGKHKQRNQHTELPKSAFQWLPEERTYRCPEGHRLRFRSRKTQSRTDYAIQLSLYTCPAEHCLTCPQQPACTRTPKKGRTVSRMEHEELLDALRDRMATDQSKRLYKLRSQTVELNYADMKEHRGLRRFHGRGMLRVNAELGILVLAHNLRSVEAHLQDRHSQSTIHELSQTPCAA
jgi:transposase